MVYILSFFFFKMQFVLNYNIFGSYIIHILYTGCAKIKINNSGAKMLRRGSAIRVRVRRTKPLRILHRQESDDS